MAGDRDILLWGWWEVRWKDCHHVVRTVAVLTVGCWCHVSCRSSCKLCGLIPPTSHLDDFVWEQMSSRSLVGGECYAMDIVGHFCLLSLLYVIRKQVWRERGWYRIEITQILMSSNQLKKKNLGSRGKQGQGREKEIHMIDAFPFHNFLFSYLGIDKIIAIPNLHFDIFSWNCY